MVERGNDDCVIPAVHLLRLWDAEVVPNLPVDVDATAATVALFPTHAAAVRDSEVRALPREAMIYLLCRMCSVLVYRAILDSHVVDAMP